MVIQLHMYKDGLTFKKEIKDGDFRIPMKGELLRIRSIEESTIKNWRVVEVATIYKDIGSVLLHDEVRIIADYVPIIASDQLHTIL